MRPGKSLIVGGVALLAACSGWTASAQNMSRLDAARSLLGTVQQVAANARLRRTVDSLSAPLSYETRIGAIDPDNPHDPRNVDVAGVRLGMSPPEVARALAATGYTMQTDAAGQPSYDSQVRERWRDAGRGGTGPILRVPVRSTWARPGQEIAVEYLALPEGARVDAVTYTADAHRISAETFEAQLQGKYGAPVNGDADEQRWCTLKAPDCEDARQAEYPVLEASAQYRRIRLAGHDKDRDAALEARLQADAAAGAPAETGASF